MVKFVLFAILKKVLINFKTSIENVNLVLLKGSLKRYYENTDKISNQQKLYYEKNKDVLLAKCKINQQNRKSHTQQIKDLNIKVEEVTPVIEILHTK